MLYGSLVARFAECPERSIRPAQGVLVITFFQLKTVGIVEAGCNKMTCNKMTRIFIRDSGVMPQVLDITYLVLNSGAV